MSCAVNPIETYRTTFLLLLKQGKTPLEALQEFGLDQFHAAMLEEVDMRGSAAWEDAQSLLNLASQARREEMNEVDMAQAIDLWLAGWTSETPSSTQVDVMSWYWRRPSRRERRPGRRYASTNQAWKALQRERGSMGQGVT